MMLDRAYCSVNEVLSKCKSCLRNDKYRLKAAANAARGVYMVHATPKKVGSSESCDMYLTNIDKLHKEIKNGNN